METPYLDEMINELDSYIGSSDNYLSKKGNEKLVEFKAIKKQLFLCDVLSKEMALQYETCQRGKKVMCKCKSNQDCKEQSQDSRYERFQCNHPLDPEEWDCKNKECIKLGECLFKTNE